MIWLAQVTARPPSVTRSPQVFHGEGPTPMAAYRDAMDIVRRHQCGQTAKARIKLKSAPSPIPVDEQNPAVDADAFLRVAWPLRNFLEDHGEPGADRFDELYGVLATSIHEAEQDVLIQTCAEADRSFSTEPASLPVFA